MDCCFHVFYFKLPPRINTRSIYVLLYLLKALKIDSMMLAVQIYCQQTRFLSALLTLMLLLFLFLQRHLNSPNNTHTKILFVLCVTFSILGLCFVITACEQSVGMLLGSFRQTSER